MSAAELGACYVLTGLWVACVVLRLARHPARHVCGAVMLGVVWPLTLVAACLIVLQGILASQEVP